MKHLLTLITIAVFCTHCTVLMADESKTEEAKTDKKARAQNLQDLLKSLKMKGAKAKPVKHEVAVPVASAGVRAAGAKDSKRFEVVWPDKKISPLTALAMNLSNSAAQGKSKTEMKKQIGEFLENFPEHKGDPLLKDLTDLLTKDPE